MRRGELAHDLDVVARPGPAGRAPCGPAGRAARCSSRCPRPRTSSPTPAGPRRPSRRSWSGRCPARPGGRGPRAAAVVCLASASDCAGFSPIDVERAQLAALHRLEHLRSGASRSCGLDRARPRRVSNFARGLVVALDVLEAGELVRDRAHVAAALDVVLAAQRVQPQP